MDDNWTSGYVAELGYTYGFYRELTPSLLGFLAIERQGVAFNPGREFHFCELGCGQGVSDNLLAAANGQGQFYATDFNPSQIAGARQLAESAGLANVHFYDMAFTAFADEPSLPESFDVIALHGIYSWISEQNRAVIADFISRKLRVGGLVYISYNALPGWAGGMPLRQLFVDHAAQSNGPIGPRVEGALGFVERLQKAGAGYFRAHPGQVERFERIKTQNRAYLAHEYFNRDWTPFYHADVARDLSAAKLSFLGSAALLESVDAINLTAEQGEILAGIGDPAQRETVKDFIVNQQFRRDVFVKGPLPLSPRLAREQWLDQRFALSTPRADVPLTVRGALGEANLAPGIYNPILDALAAGPKTLRQMVSDPKVDALGWARVTQALTILVGASHVQPCLSAKEDGKRAKSTRSFNRAVMERSRDNADLAFLASPVTGGGVPVDRFAQLFLLARENGAKTPADWAEFALAVLLAQGQRLMKDGKVLDSAEENREELSTRASSFAEKTLPVLTSLQVP